MSHKGRHNFFKKKITGESTFSYEGRFLLVPCSTIFKISHRLLWLWSYCFYGHCMGWCRALPTSGELGGDHSVLCTPHWAKLPFFIFFFVYLSLSWCNSSENK